MAAALYKLRWVSIAYCVYLTGDCQSDVQVFALDGPTVLNSNHFNVNCIPATATILSNISGDSAGFKNIGLSQFDNQSSRILYNFCYYNRSYDFSSNLSAITSYSLFMHYWLRKTMCCEYPK